MPVPDQPVKTMQDLTEHDVVCVSCARIIIPARRIHSFRERDISQAIKDHRCLSPMEAKKGFEEEVR